MKTLRFASLMFVIWSSAVYVKFGPIKEIYQENPMIAFGIALVAMIVYRISMED